MVLCKNNNEIDKFDRRGPVTMDLLMFLPVSFVEVMLALPVNAELPALLISSLKKKKKKI